MLINNRLRSYFIAAQLSGHPIRHHYDQLEAFYEASVAAQVEARLQRLLAVLRHAAVNVPWYRHRFADAGVDIDDIQDFAALARLPLLTKADTRSADLLAETHRRQTLITSRTGGSTGVVTQLLRTAGELDRLRAHALVAFRTIGLSPTCRELAIVGADPGKRISLRRWVSQRWLNKSDLNLAAIDRVSLTRCVETINRLKPEFIWGYTSILTQVAQFIQREGLTVASPVAVCNGAETMWPSDRDLLVRAFNAPVMNRYGSVDIGVIGAECEYASGLHLFDASTVVEIVRDGRPVPVGEPGEIVITHLDHFAMPLIRLVMGDLGTLSADPCRCGRPGLRLTALEGRTDDLLLSTRGQLISGLTLGAYLNRFTAISRFQIVQSSPINFLVRLEAHRAFDSEALQNGMSEMFGPRSSVRIEVNAPFALTPKYKLRRTIRNFSLEGLTEWN